MDTQPHPSVRLLRPLGRPGRNAHIPGLTVGCFPFPGFCSTGCREAFAEDRTTRRTSGGPPPDPALPSLAPLTQESIRRAGSVHRAAFNAAHDAGLAHPGSGGAVCALALTWDASQRSAATNAKGR